MMAGDNGRRGSFPGRGGELLSLPDATYGLLRDLIVERTGVLFDATKRSLLSDKLSTLVVEKGLTSVLDYYYLLRYDDQAEAHWGELMDRLSVPETYFWRQAEQIEALVDVVAHTHFAAHPGQRLRIWSAACCTGEEPISIAIALAETGMLGEMPIEIRATDGSALMISRARQGSYGERSFRQLPPSLKAKYFEADGARWRPIERIRNAVVWDVVNLMRPAEVHRYASADVIFCRNVFIYFANEAIRQVVQLFSERMADDGYVFLGAAESLTRLGVDLELVEIGHAFAYVKEGRREIVERIRPRSRAPYSAPVTAPRAQD